MATRKPKGSPDRARGAAGRESRRAAAVRRVHLKIRRQDGPERPETRRWEQFAIEWHPRMTVAAALRAIELAAVTADGKHVAPVAWESSCLEETCGACTMSIDGRVAQACSVVIDAISAKNRAIVLEPLAKFPLIRDLVVDRSSIEQALSRVHAWVDVDLDRPDASVPREQPDEQRAQYALSRCTRCGACLEACPQWGEHTDFVGAAALAQVRRLDLHSVGRQTRNERLERVMAPGGVADCGKAQNCVEVCPMRIPLVDAIQGVARETSRKLVFGWLLG